MPTETKIGRDVYTVPLSAIVFADKQALDAYFGWETRTGRRKFKPPEHRERLCMSWLTRRKGRRWTPASADFAPLREEIELHLLHESGWSAVLELDAKGKPVGMKDANGEALPGNHIPEGEYQIWGDTRKNLVELIDEKHKRSNCEFEPFLEAAFAMEGYEPLVMPVNKVRIRLPVYKDEDGNWPVRTYEPTEDGKVDIGYADSRTATVSAGSAWLKVPVVRLDLGINHEMLKVYRYWKRLSPLIRARQETQATGELLMTLLGACDAFWETTARINKEDDVWSNDERQCNEARRDIKLLADKVWRLSRTLHRYQKKRKGGGHHYLSATYVRNMYTGPLLELLRADSFRETLARALRQRSLPDDYAWLLYQCIQDLRAEEPEAAEQFEQDRQVFGDLLDRTTQTSGLRIDPLGPAMADGLAPVVRFPELAAEHALHAGLSQWITQLEVEIGGEEEGKSAAEGFPSFSLTAPAGKSPLTLGRTRALCSQVVKLSSVRLIYRAEQFRTDEVLQDIYKRLGNDAYMKRVKKVDERIEDIEGRYGTVSTGLGLLETFLTFNDYINDTSEFFEKNKEIRKSGGPGDWIGPQFYLGLKTLQSTIDIMEKSAGLSKLINERTLGKSVTHGVGDAIDKMAKYADALEAIIELYEAYDTLASSTTVNIDDRLDFDTEDTDSEDFQKGLNQAKALAHMLKGVAKGMAASGLAENPVGGAVAAALLIVSHTIMSVTEFLEGGLLRGKVSMSHFQGKLWPEVTRLLEEPAHRRGPSWIAEALDGPADDLTGEARKALESIGYRKEGRGEIAQEGVATRWNPFTRPFEVFDLEDWWGVLAASGTEPSKFDIPNSLPAWWQGTVHAVTQNDYVSGLVGMGADGLGMRPYEEGALNEWLKRNLPSLAIGRKDPKPPAKPLKPPGTVLGRTHPPTLPWKAEQGGKESHHAWLIQTTSQELLDALHVHAYGQVNLPGEEGFFESGMWDDFFLYPGLAVAVPVDYEGPGLEAFQRRARERGAINLLELISFFWSQKLQWDPEYLRSNNWKDQDIWPLLPRVRAFLGNAYADRLEQLRPDWEVRCDKPTSDRHHERSYYFYREALERAWVLVTGPLATEYKKFRVGLVSGLIGCYPSSGEAWHETFGVRYFPPAFIAKDGPLTLMRKRRSLAGKGHEGNKGFTHWLYVDEKRAEQGATLRIESCDEVVVGEDETLYVFRWRVKEKPAGTVTEVTHVRSESGDLAVWAAERVDLAGPTTRDAVLERFPHKGKPGISRYADEYGISFPEIADEVFFRPTMREGTIWALEGLEARFLSYEGEEDYSYRVRRAPPGWDVDGDDPRVVVLPQDGTPTNDALTVVVQENTGQERIYAKRYQVAKATLEVKQLFIGKKDFKLDEKPLLVGGDVPELLATFSPADAVVGDDAGFRFSANDTDRELGGREFEQRRGTEFRATLAELLVKSSKGDIDMGLEVRVYRTQGSEPADNGTVMTTIPIRRLEPWLAAARIEFANMFLYYRGSQETANTEGEEITIADHTHDKQQYGVYPTFKYRAKIVGPDGKETWNELFWRQDEVVWRIAIDGQRADGKKEATLQGFKIKPLSDWFEFEAEDEDDLARNKFEFEHAVFLKDREILDHPVAKKTLHFTESEQERYLGRFNGETKPALVKVDPIDGWTEPDEDFMVGEAPPSGRPWKLFEADWSLEPSGLGRVHKNPGKSVHLALSGDAEKGQLKATVEGVEYTLPIECPWVERIDFGPMTGATRDILADVKAGVPLQLEINGKYKARIVPNSKRVSGQARTDISISASKLGYHVSAVEKGEWTHLELPPGTEVEVTIEFQLSDTERRPSRPFKWSVPVQLSRGE